MKLAPVTEKLGLPTNLGRKFGEKYIRDFIKPGKLANLFTAFETTYPELKPILTKTFKKSNDLLGYIKPDPVGSSTVETHPNGRRVTYEDSEI